MTGHQPHSAPFQVGWRFRNKLKPGRFAGDPVIAFITGATDGLCRPRPPTGKETVRQVRGSCLSKSFWGFHQGSDASRKARRHGASIRGSISRSSSKGEPSAFGGVYADETPSILVQLQAAVQRLSRTLSGCFRISGSRHLTRWFPIEAGHPQDKR